MEERKIACPHCGEEMNIELQLQNIEKIELGIGIKVFKKKEDDKKKSAAKKKN
jgi:uncharacterized protein (UPF0212 family)